jgi:hypothetical protein
MDQPDPERGTAAEDALRRLEARLDRASEAAERLLAEAAARIGGAGGTSPGGAGGTSSGGAGGTSAGGAGGTSAGGAGGTSASGAGAAPAPAEPGLAGQPASSVDEAASAGPDTEEPPPAGWQIPGAAGSTAGRDLDLLIGAVQSLRDLIPADLQRRLSEALRELLLAVRALVDWYLERMERRRAEPTEVQDIPID